MHELGIAQSLLDLVTREVAGRPGVRVTAVHLRVGELAGVEAEALGFAFDALKPGTTCAGAALVVEPVGAAVVREEIGQREILAMNLLGGPGTGKTSLLERMAAALGPRMAVLAGDVETERDAARIGRHGVQSVAITTAGSCHLDALMVQKAIHALDLDVVRLLVIENVGNLVCPAAFDLGEAFKAVMLSVAEGDDKPLKYPAIFARAEVTLLNKIDLLAHCPDFELERARGHALAVIQRLTFFELSCRSGQGIEPWLRWVEARLKPAPAPVITV